MNSLSAVVSIAVFAVLIMNCARKLFPYSFVRAALDRRAGDGSADLYTPELHQRIVTALAFVVFAGVLGVVALLVKRKAVADGLCRFIREARGLFGTLAGSLRQAWPALLITGLVASLTRWPFIHLPMRFDEAYTYLQYASQPLYVTVSKYDAPNNHVLHSILVWLATQLGGNSPEVIRAPALVCGVLTAVVAAWWCACRIGWQWGAIVGGIVAVSSPLVEYSVNARGYSLVHLLVMLLWIVSDEWFQRPTRSAVLLSAGLAALALWTMPTAIYPLIMLGVNVWGAGRKGVASGTSTSVAWEIARAGLVVLGLTLLLYLPILVVSGFEAITSSGQGHYDGLRSWSDGFTASVQETAALLFRDQPLLAITMMFLGLVWMLWWNPRKGDHSHRATAGPTPSMFVIWMLIGGAICLLMIAIQQVVPPPRTWLFLWPFASCLLVAVIAERVRDWTPRGRIAVQLGVLLIGVVWPAVNLFTRPTIANSQETGVCPDAEAIIADLMPQLSAGEPIIAISPTSAPLAYYAQRQGLSPNHFFAPKHSRAATQPAIVVVSREPFQSVSQVLEALNLTATYVNHRVIPRHESPDTLVYELQL